jgi:hypothetical protein
MMLSLRSMSGTLVELEVYVITVIILLEFSPIEMTIYYRYGGLYIKSKFTYTNILIKRKYDKRLHD